MPKSPKQQTASFENPIAMFEEEGGHSANDSSTGRLAAGGTAFDAEMGEAATPEANFEHEMTDDALSDLTYAFQSCDIDGAGTIEPEELHGMMAALGAEVDLRTVQLVMKENTENFQKWLEEQQIKESEEAKAAAALPTVMTQDNDGKESGHHGDTKHGGIRHHHTLDIKKRHPLVRFGMHPALAPVRVPMSYSAKLLYVSGKVVTAPVRRSKPDPYKGMTKQERKKAMEEAMLSDQHMVFAEFIYLMGHREVLDRLVPGDWHAQADRMRKFRRAFGATLARVSMS
jgi:hypothetical protein